MLIILLFCYNIKKLFQNSNNIVGKHWRETFLTQANS